MIVNFRVRKISRGTHKLTPTSILKKIVAFHANKSHFFIYYVTIDIDKSNSTIKLNNLDINKVVLSKHRLI
jgi:hypothetical protein